jgi:hypothetical protein
MKWRIVPVLILIVFQAQADRLVLGDDDWGIPVPAPVQPPLRPGVGRPVVTPMPVPVPLPRPRPQTPATPGSGQILPGMIDPDAPPQDRSQAAPIWKPFLRRFNQCAPGCRPIRYNAHRSNTRLCHKNGRALDVFGMRCHDGSVHMAINSGRTNGRFAQLVNCMSGPSRGGFHLRNGLGCLWHNGSAITEGHRDHAHFSIGCNGGTSW